jgi:hydrogenase maturation factor
MDPYHAISEGTLIATVVPGRADAFVAALSDGGIESAIVGEVTEPGTARVVSRDGTEESLEHPGLDPFWAAFGAWAADTAPG